MAWPLVLDEIYGDEDQRVLFRKIGLSAETESSTYTLGHKNLHVVIRG